MIPPELSFEKLTLKLISDGHFKNKGDVASAIGERSLTDIFTGKKRIRADHLQKLKAAVPDLNVNWLFTEQGDLYESESSSIASEPQSTYVPGKGDISSLMEDIESRLDSEGRKLVYHLKVEIDEVIKERDEAKDKLISLLEQLNNALGKKK